MISEKIKITTENDRKSNFELLRIILILMIIILHYMHPNMGGIYSSVEKFSFNYWIIHLMESICIVAVDTFILITGFFMNNKNKIKVNKIVNLLYLTLVWGFIIYMTVAFIEIFTKKDIFNISNQRILQSFTSRWFVLTYVALYLLIPYINKFISSISKKQYQVLLLILVCCFYIYPTIFENTMMPDKGYGITNFVVLYLIGSYIKLYFNDVYIRNKAILIYCICVIATMICSCISNTAFNYSSIFNLLGAISLFLIFKSIKIKNNKIINKLASYTFAIYIIHENQLISAFLYRRIFNTLKYSNSNYLLLHMVFTAIGIYIICVILEFVRRLIMNKYVDSKIEKIDYCIKV